MLYPVNNIANLETFLRGKPRNRMVIILMLVSCCMMTKVSLAADNQSPEYGQQCLDSQSGEHLLKEFQSGEETDSFIVMSPNQLQLKSGVEFQVFESKSWGEVYVFGNSSAVGGNTTVCGCKGGCTPSCSSDVTGGIATCTGGCYKLGEPCISCSFRKLDVTILPSPSPVD